MSISDLLVFTTGDSTSMDMKLNAAEKNPFKTFFWKLNYDKCLQSNEINCLFYDTPICFIYLKNTNYNLILTHLL